MPDSTILIVDDHAGFRRSARSLLLAEGFDVVGEAVDARSALDQALRLHPSIVLLDIQLPDGDGFQVAAALAASEHPPVVILISSRDRATYGSQLAAASVAGFIPKAGLSAEAIRTLAQG